MSRIDFMHFLEMRKLSPLPNPRQLRDWARGDSIYADLRWLASHPMPPVLIGKHLIVPRKDQLRAVPMEFVLRADKITVAGKVIKDRYNGHTEAAAKVRYPDTDARLGEEWTSCAVPPYKSGTFAVRTENGTEGFIRFNAASQRWTEPSYRRESVEKSFAAIHPLRGMGHYRWRQLPKAVPKQESVLTDWMPATTPPAHDGVYELKSPFSAFYAKFENGMWFGGALSVEKAAANTRVAGKPYPRQRTAQWRGFTTKQD